MNQYVPECTTNPEIFFPIGYKISTEAEQMCSRCPLAKECANIPLDSIGTDYPITSGVYAGVALGVPTSRPYQERKETLQAQYTRLAVKAGRPIPEFTSQVI